VRADFTREVGVHRAKEHTMKSLEHNQPPDLEQQEGQPFVAPGFKEVEAAFNLPGMLWPSASIS